MKSHALTTAMRNAGQIWLNHLSSSHHGRIRRLQVETCELGWYILAKHAGILTVFRQRRQIFKIQRHQIRWDEDLQIPGGNVGEM